MARNHRYGIWMPMLCATYCMLYNTLYRALSCCAMQLLSAIDKLVIMVVLVLSGGFFMNRVPLIGASWPNSDSAPQIYPLQH